MSRIELQTNGLFRQATADVDTDGTARVEVAAQWLNKTELKELIAFLKDVKKQVKANRPAPSLFD